MLNKLLLMIMGVALLFAVVIGIVTGQAYTTVTAEPNVMDHFSVAVWDLDTTPTLLETMQKELPNSNHIIRAKSAGEMGYTFKNNRQYVEVLEVFQGEGIEVGDKIAVTKLSWNFYFDEMTAEVYFINIMLPENEYLIFLEEKLETIDRKEINIYLLAEWIIPPIFNYQDKENIVTPTPYDERYVPYDMVRDNEFFVRSEEALEALMEWKHGILAQYPR